MAYQQTQVEDTHPTRTTLTEKVDDSKSGWELWVADEQLIRSQPEKNNNNNNRKKNYTYNQDWPTSSSPTTQQQQQQQQQHSTPMSNQYPTQESSETVPAGDPDHDSAEPDQQPKSNEEGSLTGIGSSSNYKPANHPLSPHHDPLPTTDARSSFIYSGPGPRPFHPTHSAHQNTQIGLATTTTHNNCPPNDLTPKPEPPHSSPSTNTLGLINTHGPESAKHSRSSPTPPKPSLAPRASPAPGLRYSHAYELYDRQVSRVQPLPSNVRSQNPAMISAGGYSHVPPPSSSPKKPVQPTPPSPAPPAEVCLECMMRDRDMIGIDVVGPGIWARKSDADFEEAMRAEATANTDEDQSTTELEPDTVIPHTPTHRTPDDLPENGTVDPQAPPTKSRSRRKPLGKGNLLTAPALKAWTQMNPPASSHRWRTLQSYLREQRHYLELERKAKRSIELENERTEELMRNNPETYSQPVSLRNHAPDSTRTDFQFLHTAPRGKLTHRASSATLLSNGMVLETLDVSKDEKEAAKYRANANKHSSSKSSRRVSSKSTSAALNGIGQSPRTEPMNMNSLALKAESFNSDGTAIQSPTVNAPGTPSSRPVSPNRFSFVSRKSGAFGDSMRPFSTWGRNRRSASNSVVSLAPSGSMIDMHLGLSHDRHHPSGSFASPQIGKPLSKNRSMLNFHLSTGGTSTSSAPGQKRCTTKPSHGSLVSSPTTVSRVAAAAAGAGEGEGAGDERNETQKKEHHKKKLRHTLRGLWMKLGLGKERSCSHQDPTGTASASGSSSAPPRGRTAPNNHGNADDEPLAPPPSMSVLAREQLSHRRNRSTLSLPLSNARRLAGFRPSSVATKPVAAGGMVVSSVTSSPVSQHFVPSSPGSKMKLNGGSSPTCHQSSYINSCHDPQFDSLAEELEIPSSSSLRQQSPPARSRVRSLGTTSMFTELATTQEEGGGAGEEDGRPTRRATTLDMLRSSQEPSGAAASSREHVVMTGDDSLDSAGMPGSSTEPPGLQSSGVWSHSTSTTDKSPSIRTVLSKSSRIFHKLSGIHHPKRSSSRGSLNPLSAGPQTLCANPAAISPGNGGVGVGVGVGGAPELRTSTSSQFSSPVPSHDMIKDPAALPLHYQHQHHQQQQQLAQQQQQRPDYLPAEKTRAGVSRSADFLALRYVSLNNRDDHLVDSAVE
ncbi:hypothetical protein PCANC_21806 [Puccinia coronata f. sp. avenae]|uniref:Uncharacterized protein n=1 Tax=Puccinia coronata f. sp. avenae TaxID=200324 RepID=A0A2N5S5V2_9BASI|nr:hypothetical protein PCANC_21806 [Puccinia coronata f. sp. avenae]